MGGARNYLTSRAAGGLSKKCEWRTKGKRTGRTNGNWGYTGVDRNNFRGWAMIYDPRFLVLSQHRAQKIDLTTLLVVSLVPCIGFPGKLCQLLHKSQPLGTCNAKREV